MALSNINKNRQTYFPYIITCILTIMMYFMMGSILHNENVRNMNHGDMVIVLLNIGMWVTMIFAVVFLFYTNSFLIKRRQKEIGLYNILGMETLGIRMERVCSNAMTLAKYLNDNYGNLSVNYPGLENSEFYNIAKKELNNGFGGIITIRTGSKEKAFKFINALQIPLNVSNIGDTKTLVIHPSSTISAHSTEGEKKIAGVYDDLVRISVGIEDVQDLIEDFTQALKAAN